jgi:Ca2+:H+ antiporter
VQNADLVMLPLTLGLSIVTFASGRTNILQGAVHLLLFAAYLMLVFQS